MPVEAVTDDENYMRKALAEARIAFNKGEVPIGAVVECGGQIGAIHRGHVAGTRQPGPGVDGTSHLGHVPVVDAHALLHQIGGDSRHVCVAHVQVIQQENAQARAEGDLTGPC